MSREPQSSPLTPVLFNLFINDIEVGINSSSPVLPDDNKLCRAITSQDIAALEEHLIKMEGWAAIWQMRFNI